MPSREGNRLNAESATPQPPRGRRLAWLSLGALGVVYGDIGTSPLYALRECFHGEHAVAGDAGERVRDLVAGLLVAVLVISVKYLVFVLRADNRGEGGILALLALAVPRSAHADAASGCSPCWAYSERRCSTAMAC